MVAREQVAQAAAQQQQLASAKTGSPPSAAKRLLHDQREALDSRHEAILLVRWGRARTLGCVLARSLTACRPTTSSPRQCGCVPYLAARTHAPRLLTCKPLPPHPLLALPQDVKEAAEREVRALERQAASLREQLAAARADASFAATDAREVAERLDSAEKEAARYRAKMEHLLVERNAVMGSLGELQAAFRWDAMGARERASTTAALGR